MSQGHGKRRADEPDRVTLSVIAPCFNEESNIDVLVDRTLTVFDRMSIPAELVLVDDGSADQTWRRITSRAQRDDRVLGARHAANKGMEAAWKTGLDQASGELACLIDADLQNKPEDIPLLYEAFTRAEGDLIQAVRHPADGVRRLYVFSRTLNLILNLMFRMKSRDNKSGFVLCRREVLSQVLEHKYHYRYFQNLLGASAKSRGYRMGEVDTIFDRRHAGESFLSRLPLLVSARTCCELLKFRFETLTDRRRRAMPQSSGWDSSDLLALEGSGES